MVRPFWIQGCDVEESQAGATPPARTRGTTETSNPSRNMTQHHNQRARKTPEPYGLWRVNESGYHRVDGPWQWCGRIVFRRSRRVADRLGGHPVRQGFGEMQAADIGC